MKRIALYLEDRHQFTAALFGAWAEGTQVILPGDDLPATLQALRQFSTDSAEHGERKVSPLPVGEGQGEGLTKVIHPLTPTLSPAGEREHLPGVMGFSISDLDRELEGLLVFTSGSTGQPTAIPKKLRQLFDEVATLEATFGRRVSKDASIFSTVSHQHIYGLLFSVLWPVLTGRKLTPRRLEYPEELEQFLAPNPCVLISSPAHLKRLPDVLPWKTQLEAVFSSGGPLPEEGAARAKAVLGHQPIEIFGSSETGGIAWREGSRSCWRALAGVEFRQSPQGTLELKSPHLPDTSWFTTADRVALTGDTFQLLGRADRIAKIEEKRVSLEAIERTACSTGLVSEARAVTLPGARVTLGLVLVLSAEGRQLDRKQLLERLKSALELVVERVAIPRRFRVVDAMPHNAQGKLTEAALSALFMEKPTRPEARWVERTPARATLAISITPELRVLEGHFPEAPVVPGVAQLDWAIGWGREAFGIQGNFARMEVLKFQALMMPGHEVVLVLDWNPEKSTLTFKYSSQAASFSSGRVVLSA